MRRHHHRGRRGCRCGVRRRRHGAGPGPPGAIASPSVVDRAELGRRRGRCRGREGDRAAALPHRSHGRRGGRARRRVAPSPGRRGSRARGRGGEGAELDEAVGGPAQVGVVEEQGGPGGGRLPGGSPRSSSRRKCDQRQQGGAAAVAEAFAQSLVVAQLGRDQQGRLAGGRRGPDRPAVGRRRAPSTAGVHGDCRRERAAEMDVGQLGPAQARVQIRRSRAIERLQAVPPGSLGSGEQQRERRQSRRRGGRGRLAGLAEVEQPRRDRAARPRRAARS